MALARDSQYAMTRNTIRAVTLALTRRMCTFIAVMTRRIAPLVLGLGSRVHAVHMVIGSQVAVATVRSRGLHSPAGRTCGRNADGGLLAERSHAALLARYKDKRNIRALALRGVGNRTIGL